MENLRGKSALLTGGSYGLGPQIARALVREGVHVALVARSADKLASAAAGLAGLGGRVVTIPGDITRESDRNHAVKRTEEEFGQIDILVNNAGINQRVAFVRQEPEQIARIIDTNLQAALYLTREVLPGMLRRRLGHIVSISSLGGKKGVPYEATFAASKAALIEWTSSVRMELEGSGVGISVVCPIYVVRTGNFASYGLLPSWLAGSVSAERVAAEVIRAIRRNRQEILVRTLPTRPLLALNALSPAAGNLILKWMGIPKLQKRLVDLEAREKSLAPERSER